MYGYELDELEVVENMDLKLVGEMMIMEYVYLLPNLNAL